MNLTKLWRSPRRAHGLELWFDSFLLLLRWFSLSYWLHLFFPNPVEGQDPTARDNAIDVYCLLQFLLLIALLVAGSRLGDTVTAIAAAYILFEIYLNLLNIVFIGKFSDINAPPASIERSLLLLILNLIEIVMVFAVFYRSYLGLDTQEALMRATMVLATIGAPDMSTSTSVVLVSLQVLLDFVLVALFLGAFSGQLNVFKPRSQP